MVCAVPVGRLVPHEEHDGHRARTLGRRIGRAGVWTAPLVVERDSLMVMDGHHRLRAAETLGLSVLPVVLMSYEDAGVLLQAWRKGEVWSPAIVLSRARSGLLLPRKTTRHLFQPAIGSVAIPLDRLAAQRGLETAADTPRAGCLCRTNRPEAGPAAGLLRPFHGPDRSPGFAAN